MSKLKVTATHHLTEQLIDYVETDTAAFAVIAAKHMLVRNPDAVITIEKASHV